MSGPATPAQVEAYSRSCSYCGAVPGEACRNMRTKGTTWCRWPHFQREYAYAVKS